MPDIRVTVAKVLHIPEHEIAPSDRLKEDLGADSVDMVEILDSIEQEFGVYIPDDQSLILATVKDFNDFLAQHSNGQ